jgi:hypothetical protein
MTILVSRDDLTWSAASGCALANAGVHLYLVPAHLTEQPYVGVLFAVGAAALLAAAAGLLQPRTRAAAWWLGAAISAGMLAGYLASRTVGLPLGYHEGWDDPYGVACLLLEAAYLAAFAARTTSSP